jgi:hypothetical protein
VCRFALLRQGQKSHVLPRWHGRPCRGSLLVLPHSAGLGYRPTSLNGSPCTDGRKVVVPALGDRVFTLEIR